ncbi:hypothetical protein WOLCODRAFT_165561 [Wolfiporia cocos MD-104 SS10]|uniref:Uncharacterized protein n=1 Tax=Wolfiporia cocos (strain MD-104) TaxID=742152 RepID=A0A2H3JSA2_WOLCO|nr:hypothetical protein WOLCODRAFT_165561 [Wolfiporia cocos MD-104 SS10]
MADNVQTQHRAISNSFKAKRSIAILLANPPSDMSNRAAFLSWWADVEEAHEIYIHLARQYPDCVVPFEALPEYARYEASRVELEHNTVAESCESNERAARLSTADSKRKYIEPQQSGQSTSSGSRVPSAVSSATLPDSSQALVTANFQAVGLASKAPGVTPTMKNSEMKQELDGHEERLRQFLLAVRGNLSQSGENALTAAMAQPAKASYSGGHNSGPHTPSAESLPKFTTTINRPSDVAPRAAPAAKQSGGFTHVAGQNSTKSIYRPQIIIYHKQSSNTIGSHVEQFQWSFEPL